MFRAPSVTDLYAGPAGNAPLLTDVCVGYGADLNHDGVIDDTNPNHAAACGAVTGATNIDPNTGIEDTGLSQSTGVVSGAAYVGYDLKPEQGKSFDWGLVYDPELVAGLLGQPRLLAHVPQRHDHQHQRADRAELLLRRTRPATCAASSTASATAR